MTLYVIESVMKMTVRDLKTYIFDKVNIYSESHTINGDFIDLYKGLIYEAPDSILDLEVELIGAQRKNVVDIEVKERNERNE